MGGPAWLTGIFAAVMITVAAYCASRLVVARWRRRLTDVDSDGMHVVMGVAMAGMLVTGLRFGPAGAWEAVFAAAAGWFGWRFVRVRRGAPVSPWRCPQPVPHLVECGAMVYMYLAVPAVAVAAKGASGGMGGMSATGSRFSFLALVLALFLLGWAVRVADRLTVRAPEVPVAVLASAVPVASGPQESGALMMAIVPAAGGPETAGAASPGGGAGAGPAASVPGPPVRGAVQDRDGHHHGLHADPAALAGELVSGLFDRGAQRGAAGHLSGGDADLPGRDIDIHAGHAGQLADLGPDGAGAVIAAHAVDRDGTGFHAGDCSLGRLQYRCPHAGYRRP